MTTGGAAHRNAAMSWLRRAATFAVIALVVFLLWRTLRGYSAAEILQSIRAIPLERLLFGLMFVAGSYFCLTLFDFMAVRYAGKPLPYRKCALASFCSLSLGHNIGFAALSSGAIRYRFYTRFGLTPGEVAKVIIFCGITVGIGMITLGGIALVLRPDLAAQLLALPQSSAIGLGVACLALSALYVTGAAFLRRTISIRTWKLAMPRLKLAVAQIVIGAANYACVAGCLHQMLSATREIPYLAAAATYVLANGSALITHAPGGLGVIESVVVFLLPGAGVIGALVMFRAAYYLVPLCIGGPLFAVTEIYYRRTKRP